MEYRATRDWPFHVSCGGVIFRKEDGKTFYALLFRGDRFGQDSNTWHLPKGTLYSEETLEQCARREIKEETGLEVEIVAYLGSLHNVWYSKDENKNIDKITHYFLCRYLSGDSLSMDKEHDEVKWLEADQAMEKLALMPKNEDEIIERANLVRLSA